MKTKRTSTLTFLIVAIAASLLLDAAHAQSEPKIGVILPLTGPMVSLGSDMQKAIALAASEPDAAGVAHFVFEDDGFVPRNTISAVQKLTTLDHVVALIIFGSPTVFAAADLIERQKIPTVILSLNDELAKRHDYLFKIYDSPAALNAETVKEVTRRGYKDVAMVSLVSDAMVPFREYFAHSSPVPIVLNLEVNAGETDLRAVATRVRAANPSAVYLPLLPPSLAVLVKELRNAGYQGAFFGPPNLQNWAEIKAANGALSGAWYAGADDRNASAFYAAFEGRYQSRPVQEAGSGYDAAKVLIRAAKSGDIYHYLHELASFEGVFGEYKKFAKNSFAPPDAIAEIP